MLLSQQRIPARILDFFLGNAVRGVLQRYIPHAHRYWIGSARAGIRHILSQLRVEKHVKKVGLPAYTCQVVLDAVQSAGCEPVFYDSGVVAEIHDIKKIIKNIDALILTYNFGFLPNIEMIAALCKKHRVLLIEDCAQALGARHQGCLVGSFGDYAVYSFGISKNVGFCGGMITSRTPLPFFRLQKYPLIKLWKNIAFVMASPLIFNKILYPLFFPLLSIHLRHKPEKLPCSCPTVAKTVILHQLHRYDAIRSVRQRNGEYCARELPGVIPFVPAGNGEPSWLYFVILSEHAPELRGRLLRQGIDLGPMLTFRCLDQEKPKAADAEKKVLTFALYRPYGEIKMIIAALKKTCAYGN